MAAALRVEPDRWWPAVTIAATAHALPLLYLLLPPVPQPARVPDTPPLAVMLAPPASAEAPPSDAAIAAQPAPEAIQQHDEPEQAPEVAQGPKGTIAVAKPQRDGAPATDTPAASAAAAAPAPTAAPIASQAAAPVEGASRQVEPSTASWEAQVAARLEKAKRYPLAARMANEQDTLVVSFSVDGQGRISRAKIRRSAGYEDLEAEALNLVARVSPLPAPPERASRQMVVPIEFHLDR